MRGAWGAIAALALASGLAVAPAAAEPNAARPQAKQSAADPYDEVIGVVLGDKPGSAIAAIETMLDKADEDSDRAFLHALRGAAYLGTGKIDLAVRDFDQSRRILPDSSMVDRIRFVAGLAHERFDQSSIALDKMLASSADSVKAIEIDLMWRYLRNDKVAKAHMDDQRVALARMDYAAANGIHIRLDAVRIMLARGNIAEANALAAKVDQVGVVQGALVDRRLEAVWPAFERSAGPKMAAMIARNVADAEAAFAETPSDADNRRRLMSAYSAAQRTSDALARGAEIGRTKEALASLDEEDGWVVNQHALALFRAGRREDADRRFAELVAANPEKGWIVNMAINRLELLAQVGNHDAADKLMAFTEQNGKSFGSPYARQLIRRMKLCTAIGLKQTARVPALLADLKEHGKDAATATVEGLLCAGDVAGAEKFVLDGLVDEDRRDEYVMLRQRKPIVPDDPSLWADAWPTLRQRPTIEAAFQKAGRDLPDLYHIK